MVTDNSMLVEDTRLQNVVERIQHRNVPPWHVKTVQHACHWVYVHTEQYIVSVISVLLITHRMSKILISQFVGFLQMFVMVKISLDCKLIITNLLTAVSCFLSTVL